MAAADYRLMTEATGVRIAEALEDVTAMVGPKGDPGDVSEAELTAKLADKADVIVDTASGAIASFPDGMAAPAKDITIAIEPVQSGSGDPSPENVRPISGWTGANVTRTGKNLLDIAAYPVISIGYISTTGTFVSNSSFDCIKSFIPCAYLKGQTITFNKRCNGWDVANFAFYTEDNEASFISSVKNDGATEGNPVTTTVPSNAEYMRMTIQKGGTDFQLELGSTATAYEPYTGTTYPISWQSEAGTVYGGTLDVTTGLLTVTHGNIASYNGESLPGRWISSMDIYSAGGTPTTGAQVVYELATPQTYQLSPTDVTLLLGDNNVWADTGDSTVTYRADTKLYIQKINAPTDDDMIADAQIASGKYFIIGGNLYRSTTTIPAGDTITPGSNCILTNLADALNALNT